MVATIYEDRLSQLQADITDNEKLDRRYSLFRIACFVGVVAGVLLMIQFKGLLPWGLISLVGLVAFVVIIMRHLKIREELEHQKRMSAINQRAHARTVRAWDLIEEGFVPPSVTTHDLALDLDLVGHASLLKLLGSTATTAGRRLLFHWLLTPPSHIGTVEDRQAMVADLAPKIDFRQNLESRLEALREYDPTPFLEWCREPCPKLVSTTWVWIARFVAVAMGALTLVAALGLVPWPFWILGFFISLGLALIKVGRIHTELDRLGKQATVFSAFSKGFDHLAQADFNEAELRRLRGACADAGAALDRLDGLVSLADLRHNPVVYFPLLPLTFWDFHIAHRLQQWHAAHADQVETWFSALHHVDALSGLASLRLDQPDWVMPEFHDRKGLFSEGIGHPLLADGVRVCNDLTLGHPQPCLLITGSNMSGKSTMLRSIGLNVVLAQAGAPVCATSLTLPVCQLGTSLRVSDSLEEGISFFMAQLLRLKGVVDQARVLGHTPASEHPPRLLFLLDEILSGTNSAERQIAVRRILGHLIDLGAIGSITTHDLELARQSNMRASSHEVHFREQFESGEDGPKMTFDYQLRQGISPTVNALKFLEIMGLDEKTISGFQGKNRTPNRIE